MAMLKRRDKIVVTAEQESPPDKQTAATLARLRMGTATDQALATVATALLPALAEARDKLTPVAEQAMVQGKVRGRQAAALGLAKGSQAAALGLTKGKQAAVRWGMFEEPQPEPEPEQSHKLRNLLIVLGLGAIGAAVYKMVTGQDADPAWTAGRDSAAASQSPVTSGSVPDPGHDSVPWGDTPADEMPGMDPSAVDPVVADPAGSDPLDHEMPATTAGPIDGSGTAPTAPLASQESSDSPVPTTPDEPLERRDL